MFYHLNYLIPDDSFVRVEVLWPSQPIRIVSSVVGSPNPTFSLAGLLSS